MLNFLRRHQRYFFLVITFVIVISFTLYGVSSSMSQNETLPDRDVVKGVTGTVIREQELNALTRLISTSPLDPLAWNRGGLPNLLNDGVIEKDFLATGMAMQLAAPYFDDLKSSFQEKRMAIERFRPYVHAKNPSISAERAWQRFSPSLFQHYRELKAAVSEQETMRLMSHLYIEQAMIPPQMLKELLGYQQNQQGVSPDPLLQNSDLSLFGFKSLEEWFGPRFISLVGQFILNTSMLAEDKGYSIKLDEVRQDLYQNIYSGYRQISPNGTITPHEIEQYYHNEMRSLGLTETMALNAWKKVMLFRRFFNDLGASALVDPLAYQQFHAFAKEKVKVELYELPSALRLTDFLSVLKFQLYIEAVAPDPLRAKTELPLTLASLDQIEKKAPELIQRSFELQWTEAKKSELAASISLKDTWSWEIQDASWEKLKPKFPELSSVKASERLAFLDRLDASLRLRIDQCARTFMIEEHPEKITGALAMATPVVQTINIRSRGGTLPFSGANDPSELLLFLEKDEPCTFDNEHFYHIKVLGQSEKKELIPFATANGDGTLDKILDKRLQDAYPEAKRRLPHLFRQTDGSWKPYKEVRELIGKSHFSELLKNIEESYRTLIGALPMKAEELPLAFYSKHRMLSYVNQARTSPTDPKWFQEENPWHLVKSEKMIERSSDLPFNKEELFNLPPSSWSSLKVGDRGAIVFCRVIEKAPFDGYPHKAIEKGQQILSVDTKRDAMKNLLALIEKKKAIDLKTEEK